MSQCEHDYEAVEVNQYDDDSEIWYYRCSICEKEISEINPIEEE